MRRIVSSSTLVLEALLLGIALLIARNDASGAAVGAIAVLAVVLLVFPGMLGRPGAYVIGSLLQIPLILTGLAVPVMWFLGTLFAALWFGWLALSVAVERDQAARIGSPRDLTE